jgi:peptidoglycan/xylan/chitin deacetylase (PgdA/CDA1 family)
MPAASATVAVLTYHSIARASTSSFASLTVEPSLFDEHLAALVECELPVIPFRAVPAALAARRGAIAVTIDDGLADAGLNGIPALLRYRMPATLFVPSGYVGGRASWLRGIDARRTMLSWAQLSELARSDFEIGSHGRMHLAADVNHRDLVFRDARASRIELEEHLGCVVESFAYPFGYHAPSGRAAVRSAGFAQACAVGELPAGPDDDRWALPRLQVMAGTSAEELIELVRWRVSPSRRCWGVAKQHVWRAGRRFAGWGPPEAERLVGVAR